MKLLQILENFSRIKLKATSFFWFQMMKNVGKEQADRIFRSCDTSGDNKISLEEFRTMLSKSDQQQTK